MNSSPAGTELHQCVVLGGLLMRGHSVWLKRRAGCATVKPASSRRLFPSALEGCDPATATTVWVAAFASRAVVF